MTSDSKDMVNPDIEGPSEAMRLALDDAELAPGDIDYLNAHGTATTINDRNETNAIKKVFGKHAYELAVSSTKSMHGHPLGAGGGIEAVACIKAMQDNWVPPTHGLDEADPECDLDYVPNVGRDKEVTYAMSNSFAFGGLNAVLVFGPPPPEPASGSSRSHPSARGKRHRGGCARIGAGPSRLCAAAFLPPGRLDNVPAWWARQDSNLQPDGYEPPALTIELRAPGEASL